MVIADIFSGMSLSNAKTTTNGSSYDTSRLTRKTVFVSALTNGSGTGAGSQLYVNIEASPNNSYWWVVDSKRYESGTSVQTDIFSYDAHFPYMRVSAIGSNVGTFNVSAIITGRGV